MNKQIVLALGGNAIGNTRTEQLQSAKKIASVIADLTQQGYGIAITHGNGPQLGMVNEIIDKLALQNKTAAQIPFSARIAMTQAYIGGDIKTAILDEFKSRGIVKDVVSIVTEVLVDKNDTAFAKPTKPIGKFMSKDEAEQLSTQTGVPVMEDAGRGYRTVVPSPLPVQILKLEEIKNRLDLGNIVITCGGAGIPVIRDGENFKSVTAVIDKDNVSALLAKEIDADILLILTGIEQVTINYRKPNETALGKITAAEAQRYIDEGQFAEGSMKPKMQAAVDFAKSKSGRAAIITSLDNVCSALRGNHATKISQGPVSKGRFCL